MHIALATLEYPTEPYRAGGMCWAFAKIARGLRSLGHDVTVIVTSDRDEVIKDDMGIPVRRYKIRKCLPGRIDRALVWRFPVGVQRYNSAWSLYRALIEQEKEKPIDIVLSAAAPDSYFAAGSRRWRYVVRISSHWPLMDVSNFIPQKPGSYFSDWMECLACAFSTARISPSKLHRNIYESLGCGATHCIHTPMTTVSASDEWNAAGIPGRGMPERFVLFYGSLQAKKGSLVLADALPAVLEAHPDVHVVFIGRDLTVPVLGSMADCIRDKLSAYRDRVHLEGVLEQSVAFEFIRRAEWVILPSIMDNLPNALLEAMWFGKPVLVTRNSGTDDLIEDGHNGLVVNPHDVDALRDGLERALSADETLRHTLGANARETVLRVCDPDKAAREFEALLASVLGNPETVGSGRLKVMWNLFVLRVRWALMVIRYYRWGTPRRAVERLEKLCALYLPGYQVTSI